MGTLRSTFGYRNADSTRDLNDHFVGVVSKGVYDDGLIANSVLSVVSGLLKIDILPFKAMSYDGMTVFHEGTPERLTVTANSTQYVVLRAKYVTAAAPVKSLEVLSASAYEADAEYDYLVVLGKIVLGPGATQVLLTDIDFRENHITNPIGRHFIRGVVDEASQLPTNVKKNVTGDCYLAVTERQFYRWNGTIWQSVTDGVVADSLSAHLISTTAHAASAITSLGNGGTLTSYTNVQTSLNGLDSLKVAAATLVSTSGPGSSLVGNTAISASPSTALTTISAGLLPTQLTSMYTNIANALDSSYGISPGVESGLAITFTAGASGLSIGAGTIRDANGKKVNTDVYAPSAGALANGVYIIHHGSSGSGFAVTLLSTGITQTSIPICIATVTSNAWVITDGTYYDVRRWATFNQDSLTVGATGGNNMDRASFNTLKSALLHLNCYNTKRTERRLVIRGDLTFAHGLTAGTAPGTDDYIDVGNALFAQATTRLQNITIEGQAQDSSSKPKFSWDQANYPLFSAAGLIGWKFVNIHFEYTGGASSSLSAAVQDPSHSWKFDHCSFDGDSVLERFFLWSNTATARNLGGKSAGSAPMAFDYCDFHNIAAGGLYAFHFLGSNSTGSLVVRNTRFHGTSPSGFGKVFQVASTGSPDILCQNVVFENCAESIFHVTSYTFGTRRYVLSNCVFVGSIGTAAYPVIASVGSGTQYRLVDVLSCQFSANWDLQGARVAEACVAGSDTFIRGHRQTVMIGNDFLTDSYFMGEFESATDCNLRLLDITLGNATPSLIAESGQTGSVAAISAVTAGQATITGLTGMETDSTMRWLTLTGAGTGANNGTFPISEYISATSVKYINAAAVSGDTGITWVEKHPGLTSVGAITGGVKVGDTIRQTSEPKLLQVYSMPDANTILLRQRPTNVATVTTYLVGQISVGQDVDAVDEACSIVNTRVHKGSGSSRWFTALDDVSVMGLKFKFTSASQQDGHAWMYTKDADITLMGCEIGAINGVGTARHGLQLFTDSGQILYSGNSTSTGSNVTAALLSGAEQGDLLRYDSGDQTELRLVVDRSGTSHSLAVDIHTVVGSASSVYLLQRTATIRVVGCKFSNVAGDGSNKGRCALLTGNTVMVSDNHFVCTTGDANSSIATEVIQGSILTTAGWDSMIHGNKVEDLVEPGAYTDKFQDFSASAMIIGNKVISAVDGSVPADRYCGMASYALRVTVLGNISANRAGETGTAYAANASIRTPGIYSLAHSASVVLGNIAYNNMVSTEPFENFTVKHYGGNDTGSIAEGDDDFKNVRMGP